MKQPHAGRICGAFCTAFLSHMPGMSSAFCILSFECNYSTSCTVHLRLQMTFHVFGLWLRTDQTRCSPGIFCCTLPFALNKAGGCISLKSDLIDYSTILDLVKITLYISDVDFFTLLLMWVSFKALGWAAGQNICLQTMCSWEFLGRPRCPESWVRCFSFESNTAVMSRAVIDFMPITQMVSGAVGFNLLENVFESRLHARPHSIWNPKNEFCLCSWFPAWSVMLNYIL